MQLFQQKVTKKEAAGFLGLTEFILPKSSIVTRSIQKEVYDGFDLGNNPLKKKAFVLFMFFFTLRIKKRW